MSSFRLSPGGRRAHEPWFRIGTLEVGTTWLVVLLSIVGVLVCAVAGWGSNLVWNLVMDPSELVHEFRFWTLLTWPFAYGGIDIFTILAIFVFWWVGIELERDLLGRVRWAWMLALWTVALAAIMVVIYAVSDQGAALNGMGLLEMMAILLWIAEWPHRRFFLSIPAWVVGVVLVAIQLIQYLGDRDWTMMIDFVFGIVACALIARQFGMLEAHPWIPRFVGGGSRGRGPRRRLHSVPPAQPAAPSTPRTVVTPGPWSPPVSQADEDRMNALLEKIHEHGADSLTERERTELNELRLRRRQGR